MEERLQKVLAHSGVASRRNAEAMIVQGRVTVNGELMTELGVKVDPTRDVIEVDGDRIRTEKKVYYLMNKPRAVTCTAEDELGRKTVLDLLEDVRERVYPVGRLDRDSEGLLVLTNDGELANYLTHPRFGVTKSYRVTVEGEVDEAVIETLREKGVRIGAVLIRVVTAKIVRRSKDSTALEVVVGEGINREVRRLFAALGHEVKRLIRTRIGPLYLDKITRGSTRPMTRAELKKLEEGMKRAEKRGDLPDDEDTPSPTRTRYFNKSEKRMGKPDPAKSKGRRRPAPQDTGESSDWDTFDTRPQAEGARPTRSTGGDRKHAHRHKPPRNSENRSGAKPSAENRRDKPSGSHTKDTRAQQPSGAKSHRHETERNADSRHAPAQHPLFKKSASSAPEKTARPSRPAAKTKRSRQEDRPSRGKPSDASQRGSSEGSTRRKNDSRKRNDTDAGNRDRYEKKPYKKSGSRTDRSERGGESRGYGRQDDRPSRGKPSYAGRRDSFEGSPRGKSDSRKRSDATAGNRDRYEKKPFKNNSASKGSGKGGYKKRGASGSGKPHPLRKNRRG